MNGPYDDDDLSADDQAILDSQAEHDKQLVDAPGGKVPGIIEGDNDDAAADTIKEAEAEAAAKAAPKKEEPAAPPAPPADADPPGETLEAFIERHKDKSPAELAGLIANREKRQAREGFQRRRGRSAEAIQADRDALKARRDELTTRRGSFDKQLEEDPDAAARVLADHALQADLDRVAQAEAALANEEHIARLDQAIEFGNTYIADFPKVYPAMREFGQAIGYSEADLDGISDGRDLLALNLARIAGNLMQAGIIDVRGNLLPQVKPVADTPTDPRLRAPAAPAKHSGPANGAAPAGTIEQQISAALSMSDADFDKLSDN